MGQDGLCTLRAPTIQRAREASSRAGYMEIDRRGLDACVPQQLFDLQESRAIFEQVRGERVPQGMNRYALGDRGLLDRIVERSLDRTHGDVGGWVCSDE